VTTQRKAGSKWIRKDKRLAIYLRDGFACTYCGCDVLSGSSCHSTGNGAMATLDHVVAVELGGSNDESNLVTSCLSCNSSKQDKSLREFLAGLTDAKGVAKRVRNRTRRSLRKYRRAAKMSLRNA